MSKLKINDKVIVKSNGKIGVIKGREMHKVENQRIAIEYIVKTDEGFQNWNAYGKKELIKVDNGQKEILPKYIVVDAPNGYKVTLVALVKRENVWKSTTDEFGFFGDYVRKGKRLMIGYSIYNPNDEYDEDLGIRIATHRAKKSPFCNIVSDFSGEFNKETIDALLKVKGEYIAKNINKFISK